MDRVESVVKYYLMNNKLKDVIRSGWKNWNVKRERIESVAEHIFGTQTLAIAMYYQYQYELDLKKVLYMLAIHELEETIIGDLTMWDISPKEKLEKGHNAIKEVLKDILNKEEIEELILEFDRKETNEAKFAYHIDKMECNLQCKLYDQEGCVNINEQGNNKTFYDKRVQDLLKQEDGNWSRMWLEHTRDKFEDDKNFLELLDYVKNNNI